MSKELIEEVMDPIALRDKIRELRRRNANQQPYIPDQQLSLLITHEVVHAEFKRIQMKTYLLEELTGVIILGAKKVFAILVLIEEVRLVRDLANTGKLQDSSLPLQLEDLEGWDASVSINFCDTQWQFLSPCFTRSMITKSINPKCVLPFLKDTPINQGAFGTVYEVCLDPEHQDITDGFPKRLVRKNLKHSDDLIELENLGILSRIKHPNVVEILGSYEYIDGYNLLFPLAEGGDLSLLLTKQREDTPFQSDESFLVAAAGLASALELVHNFVDEKQGLQLIGCHFNFCPSNVLVSKQNLILAGFGRAQFKDAGEEPKTMFRHNVGPYLAPEGMDPDTMETSEISRSSDIWSFGCILLEIMVYMAFGPEGVRRFAMDRRFQKDNFVLSFFHCGLKHNPAVDQWLSKLGVAGFQSTRYLVALTKRMLSLNESERPIAKEVTASLRLLVVSKFTEFIGRLFESISVKEESQGIFLQLKRFEAWKHVFGIINHNDAFTAKNSLVLGDKTFHLTLQSLQMMRYYLSLMSSLNKGALAAVGFGELAKLNDYFESILDKMQQIDSTETDSEEPAFRENVVDLQASHNRLKGSERDSGYASASRSETLMDPSEPTFQENSVEFLAAGEFNETKHPCDDEVQSLLSDNDDIRSQASTETTNEELTGKAHIRVFLAEEPQFRSLCEKAMAQMNKKRFVENLRRLLKSFHKNLSMEAETEAEKAVVRLLRSRRGRLRISYDLASQIQQEQEEILQGSGVDLRIAPEATDRLETWLAHISEKPIDPQGDTWAKENSFEDQRTNIESSTSSDDSTIEGKSPHISELKKFLRRTRSFQNLLKDCMLMFLPIDLRHVLLSIPKEHVWVSGKQDISVTNRFKAWVEDNTQVKWNWWPLEPRKRLLQDGESRMFWQCPCGIHQWEEISVEQHELVTKILGLSDNKLRLPYWCRTKKTRPLAANWIKGIFRKAPHTPPAESTSSAAQRYTPPGNAAYTLPSTSRSSSNAHGRSSPTASIHHQRSPITSQRGQRTAPDSVIQSGNYILFGVQGSGLTLTPGQIPVDGQSTDFSVFQDMKKCYQANRGQLRLWFSIWQVEYCEVVKFNRLTPDRMVRDHRDLPTDNNYSPRFPEAKNPPFSSHLFQALFYTCCSPRRWHIHHDCVAPPSGDKYMKRIPKRNRSFEGDQTSPIWGLEAVFAVSFAYVFVYHFVMVVGPFVFLGLWLKVHPGDFQNASVPVTVVLGALSLFWSGAGILTSKS